MKVKTLDINIKNTLKILKQFHLEKNKVLTIDDFFEILEKNKYNDKVIYEIVQDNDDIEKEVKEYVASLKLSKEKELFFLNQIKFNTGNYSYKDLYNLIEYYIEKIKKEYNPYNNFYPIIVEDKTYIDNLALFLACLKLGLKPALIDKSFISKLEELNMDRNSGDLYICSSGSSFQKLVPLKFESILEKYSKLNNESRIRRYSTITIKGILGIYTNILMPIIDESTIVINDYTNYFENVDKYRINTCYLPTNFEELITSETKKLKFSHLKKCVFAGGYLNPYSVEKLGNLKNKIIQVYGQTEQSGYISQCKYSDMVILDLPFCDLLWIYLCCSDKNKIFFSNFNWCFDFTQINASRMTLDYMKSRTLNFLSVGIPNENINLVKTNNDKFDSDFYKPFTNGIEFGEIYYRGNPTGDIGLIFNNRLYVLYRKNNFESLIKNRLKSILGVDCQISEIYEKKFIVFEDKNLPIKTLAEIYSYFCFNRRLLQIFNFDTKPYFGKLERSKGLKKVVKNVDISKCVKFERDNHCICIERELLPIVGGKNALILKKGDTYFAIIDGDSFFNKSSRLKIEKVLEKYKISSFSYLGFRYLLEFVYHYNPMISIDDEDEKIRRI